MISIQLWQVMLVVTVISWGVFFLWASRRPSPVAWWDIDVLSFFVFVVLAASTVVITGVSVAAR